MAPPPESCGGRLADAIADRNGVRGFLGIPYAAPPVGTRRWKAPGAVPSWAGVRRVDTFGNTCVQEKPWRDVDLTRAPQSEDCLLLNVWTTTTASGCAPPRHRVDPWWCVHGGVGSGTAP